MGASLRAEAISPLEEISPEGINLMAKASSGILIITLQSNKVGIYFTVKTA